MVINALKIAKTAASPGISQTDERFLRRKALSFRGKCDNIEQVSKDEEKRRQIAGAIQRGGEKMGAFFGKEELENLKSLKRDLIDPVKTFTEEVYDDSIGDAGRFYAGRAQRAQRSAELARERTREKMAAIRKEREEMKRRRSAMMKRAAIIMALLALFGLIVMSAALSARADGEDALSRGNACLASSPPDHENAAIYYRRAGLYWSPIKRLKAVL